VRRGCGPVAHAAPGGVVFHCGGGRDRTGLVALVVLALVGVVPEDIASDYELSNLRLPPFWAARREDDQRPLIDEILARKRTSARALLFDILASLDAEDYLHSGGLREHELAAVRGRLLGSRIGAAAPSDSSRM
jgi:protein-tyrosine phosphatase